MTPSSTTPCKITLITANTTLHPKYRSHHVTLHSLVLHYEPSDIASRYPPSGRGTVVLIVSCRCTYCCPETSHGKITRQYSRYCTVAFCYVHKCELSYMCPGHDIKLHPHRVKIYRIGCMVFIGLVLAKALT